MMKRAVLLALACLLLFQVLVCPNYVVGSSDTKWSIYYEGNDESAYRYDLEERTSGLEIWLYAWDGRVDSAHDWLKIVVVGYPLTANTSEGEVTIMPILGVMKIGCDGDIGRDVGGLHVIYYILPEERDVYYVNVTLHVPRSTPRLDTSRSTIKAWTPRLFISFNKCYQSLGWTAYESNGRRGRAALVSFGVPVDDQPMHSMIDLAFGLGFEVPTTFVWNPNVYVEYACVGGINLAPESFVGTGNYSCLINVGIGRGDTSGDVAVISGPGQTVYKVRAGEGQLPPYQEQAASGAIDILLDVLGEVSPHIAIDMALEAISYVLWVYELEQIVGSLGFNEVVVKDNILVFKGFDVRNGLFVWSRYYAEVASAGFTGGIVNFWGEFPFGSSVFDNYGYSVTELHDENGNVIEGGIWIGGIAMDYYNPNQLQDYAYITIRPDGSVEPFFAPITTTDLVNYRLYDNVNIGISIQRNGVTLDGCNHTIDRISPRIGGTGIGISSSNVTVRNLRLINAASAVSLDSASNCTIESVRIANVHYGISFAWSKGNTISNCSIEGADVVGLLLDRFSEGNSIVGNEFISCSIAVQVEIGSFNCLIAKNNFTDCGIAIIAERSHVEGNRILRYSDCGIMLKGSDNEVVGNTIVYGGFGTKGILFKEWSSNSVVTRNSIYYCNYAIYLAGTSNDVISFNNIMFGIWGVYVGSADNVTVVGNNMMNITYLLFGSGNVLVYNNNFINGGADEVYLYSSLTWDNGYPCGGNYWGEYSGRDERCGPNQDVAGSDGIIDEPYVIDWQNVDRYPLVEPFGELLPVEYGYQAGNFSIDLISNSTVLNFTCDLERRIISFEVFWRNGTTGFVNLTVPASAFGGEATVFLDGKPVPFNISRSTDFITISFMYEHSKHVVEIEFEAAIPEFPISVYIILIMAVLAVVCACQRKYKKDKEVRSCRSPLNPFPGEST